jgi:hypothetical protein
LYPRNREFLLVAFDLRDAGAVESLHSQRAAWGEYSDLEALDRDHFVLVVLPGRVLRVDA